jgi:hypothetical protein
LSKDPKWYIFKYVRLLRTLAAWHSGHRCRLQTRGSQVRIPTGCKIFRSLYIAVPLSKLNVHCHCVYLGKIYSSKIFL